MAVSFACSACKTLIQVGEEMSGQTGQCPRCERTLPAEAIRSGLVLCPLCDRVFEATAFQPAQRKLQVVETAATFADIVSNDALLPSRLQAWSQ